MQYSKWFIQTNIELNSVFFSKRRHLWSIQYRWLCFESKCISKKQRRDTYSNCIYLIAVKINNDLFVLQKSNRLKKLTKVANTLSVKLDTTIVVKAMLSGVHNIEYYNVYTADHATEDNIVEE